MKDDVTTLIDLIDDLRDLDESDIDELTGWPSARIVAAVEAAVAAGLLRPLGLH